MRYIDLNPVWARIIDDPAAYASSSYAGLSRLRDDFLLTPHPIQASLGANAYRPLLAAALNEEDLARIQQQRAYGCDDFRSMVEARTWRSQA